MNTLTLPPKPNAFLFSHPLPLANPHRSHLIFPRTNRDQRNQDFPVRFSKKALRVPCGTGSLSGALHKHLSHVVEMHRNSAQWGAGRRNWDPKLPSLSLKTKEKIKTPDKPKPWKFFTSRYAPESYSGQRWIIPDRNDTTTHHVEWLKLKRLPIPSADEQRNHPNSYAEILPLSVMVLGGRALGGNKVMRMQPSWTGLGFVKETPDRELSCPPSTQWQDGGLWHRKQVLTRHYILLRLDGRLPSLQNGEK